jgi:hypothetical protein
VGFLLTVFNLGATVGGMSAPGELTVRDKSARIGLRLTPEQEERFKEAARLAGLSLSSWICDVADLAALRALEASRKAHRRAGHGLSSVR